MSARHDQAFAKAPVMPEDASQVSRVMYKLHDKPPQHASRPRHACIRYDNAFESSAELGKAVRRVQNIRKKHDGDLCIAKMSGSGRLLRFVMLCLLDTEGMPCKA